VLRSPTSLQKWHVARTSATDFVPEDPSLERNNCSLCKYRTASWDEKM